MKMLLYMWWFFFILSLIIIGVSYKIGLCEIVLDKIEKQNQVKILKEKKTIDLDSLKQARDSIEINRYHIQALTKMYQNQKEFLETFKNEVQKIK